MKLSMSGFLEGRCRYIQTVPRGTGVPMCNVVQRGATRKSQSKMHSALLPQRPSAMKGDVHLEPRRWRRQAVGCCEKMGPTYHWELNENLTRNNQQRGWRTVPQFLHHWNHSTQPMKVERGKCSRPSPKNEARTCMYRRKRKINSIQEFNQIGTIHLSYMPFQYISLT